jgi:hypothetical protein
VISCCLYVLRYGCSFTSLDVLTHSRTARHGKAAHAAAHPGGATATRRVEESSGFPVPAARGRYNTTTRNYDAASRTCFPGRSNNAVDVRARVVISLQLQRNAMHATSSIMPPVSRRPPSSSTASGCVLYWWLLLTPFQIARDQSY